MTAVDTKYMARSLEIALLSCCIIIPRDALGLKLVELIFLFIRTWWCVSDTQQHPAAASL